MRELVASFCRPHIERGRGRRLAVVIEGRFQQATQAEPAPADGERFSLARSTLLAASSSPHCVLANPACPPAVEFRNPLRTNVRLLVERTGDTSATLTINYQVGGSAKLGADYQPLPGATVIPAGAASVKIKIKPIDNATVNGARGVKIKLLTPTDGSYVPGSPAVAKIKVIDND